MTRLALALDLGGTKLDAALVSSEGEVLAASRNRVPTGRELTPAGMEQALRTTISPTRPGSTSARFSSMTRRSRNGDAGRPTDFSNTGASAVSAAVTRVAGAPCSVAP